jgi:hypothetical protein
MIVFNPQNQTHTLFFIPRKEHTTCVLKITNELRNTESQITIIGNFNNGVFFGDFEYNFSEGASYEIEINSNIYGLLFRGKAFATSVNDLQNYKLIK